MASFATMIPFIAGILFVLISPLLVTKVKRTVQAQIREDQEKLGILPGKNVQPPLAPRVIDDYIEYAADAVQVVPVTLLPVLGAIFTVSSYGASVITLSLLFFVVVAAIALDLYVTNSTTPDYVSRKLYGYSLVSVVALCSNALGLFVSIYIAPES